MGCMETETETEGEEGRYQWPCPPHSFDFVIVYK
jgi:hypothetical protein